MKFKIGALILISIAITVFTASVHATGLNVAADHKFNINGGSVNTSGSVVNAGTLDTTTGSINLGGNWTNTGTFSGGTTGTVEFSGTSVSTITGANTFVNFTCTQAGKELRFESDKVQTIKNRWTITGGTGNLILLRRESGGEQWSVDPQSFRNITFVDVKDSNNINSTIIEPTNSTDSGNNTNWFGVSVVTPTPTTTITSTPTPVATATPIPTSTVTSTPAPTSTPETIAPTAEFEADPIGGFVPLTVQFKDKSNGNPTSWQWEFGDGDISSEQNPEHTYSQAGNFTVTLKVTNSRGSDTEEKLSLIDVESIGDCNAAFNADKTTGFAPLEVQFSDKSTGDPTSWSWKFGDGDISSEQNPIHKYQTAGIFSVTLKITASCGSDEQKQTNLIIVDDVPETVAEFNASPTSGFAPLDVQFNNLSTGEPVNFAWKFGDGGSSTDENPKHTYKTAGIFTPGLLVSNSSGADIESKTNLINVQSGEAPTADFNASPPTGIAPLNVQFTDASAGNIDNWTWDFGDGVVSSLQNPEHNYLSPGFYNVKLIVSGSDGIGTENKVNIINVLEGEEPTAAFFAEPLTGNAPFTVHFFDTSGGDVANYIWDFGDGNTSTDQNPVHKYENPGIFTVKLTVSNKDGTDIETKTNLIFVQDGVEPSAGFVIDNSDIEENSNTVEFKDISSSPDDEIIKREWDFGDGTTSEEKDPEHIYTGSEGDTFTVSLTVQNADSLDTVTKPSFVSIESSLIPGFVKGMVTDKNTGNAIKDAIISIINSSDSEIASVETTTDGLYFIQLPPGDYTLSVNKDGFNEITKNVSTKESVTETVNIELGDGEEGCLTVEPITATSTFRRLTAIVTATDEDGNPILGVTIEASASTGSKVNPPSKKTDKDGKAKFKFRFNPGSNDGVITFTSKGFCEVTITQE